MRINNLKALDYQHQGKTLVLAFPGDSVDMDDLTELDAAKIQIETEDGTPVETLLDYTVQSVTYNMAEGVYTVVLEKGVTDTAAVALAAVRKDLEAAQGHILDLQRGKEEMDSKLEGLAQDLGSVEPSVGNAALESAVYLNRILLENAVKAGSLTPTQIVACDGLVEPWAPGIYSPGDICADGGTVWRCIQPHDSTANPDWTPTNARVLWVPYHTTDPEKARPYIAPTMAEDAYNKGECMIWTDGTIKRANRDGVVHDPDILPVAWDTVAVLEDTEEGGEEAPATVPATVSILDGMTVPQLKTYAANNGIDLGGATLKADIRAAIEAAEARKETV